MKTIYRFKADCGRQGQLEGVFVEDSEMVKCLIEKQIKCYFGEVLGKYSEIFGGIEEEELVSITSDIDAINLFEKYDLSSGYNPFDYPAMAESIEMYNGELNEYEECSVRELCKQIIIKK